MAQSVHRYLVVLKYFWPLSVQQHKLRAYCRDKGIIFQAYNSLGTPSPVKANVAGVPRVMESEVVKRICKKHSPTPPQVCLAFAMSLGDIVIPKTTSDMRENLLSVSFKLDNNDMITLGGLEKGLRYQDLSWFFPADMTSDDIWDTHFDYEFMLY